MSVEEWYRARLDRPGLPPPGEDDPRARDVFEDWDARARHALEAWRHLYELEPPGPAADASSALCETAYELLACWGGLARLRRPFADEAAPLAQVLADLAHGVGRRLVELALEVPDPDGWLEEAREWHDACLEPTLDPTERARRSRELFEDLDDAQLVAWACGRLAPGQAAELQDRLEICVEEAMATPEDFLPAERFLRPFAQTLAPDLGDRDPDLALTVDLLVPLLGAVDDAWRLGTIPSPAELGRHEMAAWRWRLRTDPKPGWLDRVESVIESLADDIRELATAPAALPTFCPPDASGKTGTTEGDGRAWRSEAGGWHAVLALPAAAEAADEALVTLTVCGLEGSWEAVLYGCRRALEPTDGGFLSARFTLGELRAAEQDARVGLVLLAADGDGLEIGIPTKG